MTDVYTVRFLFSIGVSLLVSFVTNRLILRNAVQLGVLVHPTARRRHSRPISAGGGVAIILGFFAGLLCWCILNPTWFADHAASLWPLAATTLLTTFLGFMDDRKVLKVKHKFLAQFVICLGIFLVPEVRQFSSAFFPGFGFFVYPLVLIFVIGIANAANFIDGADGLLATNLLLIFGGLLWRQQAHLSGFAPVMVILLAASLISFLTMNWPPARIFMGDSGSLTLGFLLVLACLSANPSPNGPEWNGTWSEGVAGVLTLAYPILDLLWVIARRLSGGFSPFRADRNHFHHCLQRLGFSVRGCLMVLGTLNLIFQLAAWQVDNGSFWAPIMVAAATTLLFLTWIRVGERARTELLRAAAVLPDQPAQLLALEPKAENGFFLVIDVRPLFEGGSAQTRFGFQSLTFLLEANSPRGSRLCWNSQGCLLFLFFPNPSVAPSDVEGLLTRIQRLVDHWVELFNISLSAPSLRVRVGGAVDLDAAQENLRIVVKLPGGSRAA